ncbi:MAG TPA: DUF2339 domain-containing protein, partial [Caldimonas sp.]
MMLVIAIIVGALIGAATSGEAGALAGALFGWLIVRSLRQQREIEALHRRAPTPSATVAAEPLKVKDDVAPVRVVEAAGVATPTAAVAPQPMAVAAAFAGEAALARNEPIASATSAQEQPAAVAMARSPITGDDVTAAPSRDLLAPVRQWLFGGNTIVKAGVGILFIGLAFLAKYASEHAHLPVEVRLAAIGAAAIVLLGFGWRLRFSRPDYAQVLQGGAVAVLYLTLFAAFRYYGVLAATPAFVLMVAVAALAAALAVLQDARALAVVGALGGFATP